MACQDGGRALPLGGLGYQPTRHHRWRVDPAL